MDKSFIEKLVKKVEKTSDVVRYEMLENFDLFYTYVIFNSLIAKKPEYMTLTFDFMYQLVLKKYPLYQIGHRKLLWNIFLCGKLGRL
jgi:hypothetical protein